MLTIVLLYLVLSLPALGAERFLGKVVGISDGDTLSVLREGKAAKVQLHGIDCPERKQAFGAQARQFTGELAFHQLVTVLVRTTDRYGRLVGVVLLPEGQNLNHELVQAGMAWWDRRYAPHDAILQQLEAEARYAQRGLWSDPHAKAPWEWRKTQKGARAPQ